MGHIYLQDGVGLVDQDWQTWEMIRLPDYRDYSGPSDFRLLTAFSIGRETGTNTSFLIAALHSWMGLVPGMMVGGSADHLWGDWSTDRSLPRFSAVAPIVVDQGATWAISLKDEIGWQLREMETGVIIDTIPFLPSVRLHSGGLFVAGVADLFFFDETYMWVLKGGVLEFSANSVTTEMAPAGITLNASPNPFNATVSFSWTALSQPRSLEIYNVLGQPVRTYDLVGNRTSGTLSWDGTDQQGRALASGVYLARLVGEGEVVTVKVVLLK
jgi:hypothetical protein